MSRTIAEVAAMITKHNLAIAREYWIKDDLKMATHFILLHLESHPSPVPQTPESENETRLRAWAAKEQMRLVEQMKPPSEEPSSEGTETAEETKHGWITSFKSWCRVNLDGTLTLFPPQDIWASVSSRFPPGNWPGVEIGVTLTSKGSTPPAGSASPSIEAPTREGNGHAGEQEMVEAMGPIRRGAEPVTFGDLKRIIGGPGSRSEPTPSSPSPAIHAQGEEA